MAFPTIYIDTGGATTNSGSSDNNSPDLDSVGTGQTVSVSGTTVTFSGAVDLSGVANDGSETIRIADATNSGQKIFKITAVDDGADTVTVTPAPTGTISTSAWAIGGRLALSGGNFNADLTTALEDGWTVMFNNSPASHSGSTFMTMATGGSKEVGRLRFVGKAGAKRTLTVSDNNTVLAGDCSNSSFENLEFVSQGASASAVTVTGNHRHFYDCKFSDAGGSCQTSGADRVWCLQCEYSGAGASGFLPSALGDVTACYYHDNANSGYSSSSNSAEAYINWCIFDTNTNYGVNLSGGGLTTPFTMIVNCTFYGNGDGGLRFADTTSQYPGLVFNCAFKDNGGAAEANIMQAFDAQPECMAHKYNIYHHAGAGTNLINLTADATEIVDDDPEFTDAANGDFSLAETSPARSAGFGTFPGGLSVSYTDIGAVQSEPPAGGGGGNLEGLHPIGQGILG